MAETYGNGPTGQHYRVVDRRACRRRLNIIVLCVNSHMIDR